MSDSRFRSVFGVVAFMAVLLSSFLANSVARARGGDGGDRVGNGGGIAEQNVLRAYLNLERYIQTCLSVESCRLNQREKTLLEKIAEAMPAERTRKDQLNFVSERSSPGTFQIDGEIKIARTGNDVGSPVLVNTDLLYTRNSLGFYEPIQFADAIAVLVHEFGHHHGNESHTELDALGLKVASQTRRLIYVTPLLPLRDHVALHVLNGTSSKPTPETLLYLTDEITDLSQRIKKAVVCPLISVPISIGPINPITIPSHPPQSFLLHNLHWDKVDDSKDETRFEAVGNLTLSCKGNDLSRGDTRFSLHVAFVAKKVPSGSGGYQWKFKPDSLAVWQTRQPWLKLISFP